MIRSRFAIFQVSSVTAFLVNIEVPTQNYSSKMTCPNQGILPIIGFFFCNVLQAMMLVISVNACSM